MKVISTTNVTVIPNIRNESSAMPVIHGPLHINSAFACVGRRVGSGDGKLLGLFVGSGDGYFVDGEIVGLSVLG